MIYIPKNRKKYKNRKIDSIGRVILNTQGLMELLLSNESIDGLLVEDNIEAQKYNKFGLNQLKLYTKNVQNKSIEDFDKIATQTWFTPIEYQKINIDSWLLSKCKTEKEKDRVIQELNIYKEKELYPLLQHLIFLIDHFRKNNVLWGVGRGSSVASYVLFLIGVHKVDSIKYNLDITEFLK